MSDAQRQQIPEIYEELAESLTASLKAQRVPPAAARTAVEKAINDTRQRYGGTYVYFPLGLGYKVARRNAEIRRRLRDGEDRDKIRREFELSDMRLRQIERDGDDT